MKREYNSQFELQFAESIKNKVLSYLKSNSYYDNKRIKAEDLALRINEIYNLKIDNRIIQNVKSILIRDGVWITASRSSKNGGISICTSQREWNKYKFNNVNMLMDSIRMFGFKASIVNNDTVFVEQ